MWPDRISNPGPLALESDALTTVLRSSARIKYTTICPPVRGDNPRALASGLSPVQVDKP